MEKNFKDNKKTSRLLQYGVLLVSTCFIISSVVMGTVKIDGTSGEITVGNSLMNNDYVNATNIDVNKAYLDEIHFTNSDYTNIYTENNFKLGVISENGLYLGPANDDSITGIQIGIDIDAHTRGCNGILTIDGTDYSYITLECSNESTRWKILAGVINEGEFKIEDDMTGKRPFHIQADTENDLLKLTNATVDYVQINDVLNLHPLNTEPSSAPEGSIYYDSTFNKLRLKNDTGFVNVTVS